jgi:hypothetical protein
VGVETGIGSTAVAIVLALVVTVGTAWGQDAQDQSEQDQHELEIDATFSGSSLVLSAGMFYPEADTYIRVDGTGGVFGTELNFDTLGLADNEVLPALGFVWQANSKHGVWGNYFELDRSGFTNTAIEIRIGNTVFPIGANIDAQFSSKVLAVGYGYSIFNDTRRFLGFRIGLNVQDIRLAVATENGLLAETADVTAPLPTFGFVGGYELSENWLLFAQAGYLGLTVDEYKGAVTELSARLSYALTEHFSLSLAYRYLKVEVDSEDADWRGKLRYEYLGPSLSLDYRF